MLLSRISLAAKYRILFGLAVALIIGAALCVPWMRMEALVLEQSFRAARRAADEQFKLLHLVGDNTALVDPRTGAPPTLLGDESAAPTRFYPFFPQPPGGTNRFVADAMRRFLRNRDQNEDWTADVNDPQFGRRFYYAHAVRVDRTCLECHGEGSARPYVENELAGLVFVNHPANEDVSELMWNRAYLVASGALAGTLAILVFYVITHRFILSPIQSLRSVAAHVAEGNLDERANLQTGDEFEQLSDSLNNMFERLRASQDELRKANRLLDQKLGEMAETNVGLYEANRLKSEFLANVSHELRTPLTSIIGFAELLREGPLATSDNRSARYAENILISGRILLEIINDLLDLAKIEAGKMEVQLASLRVEDVCRALLDFMRPQADKKSITLRFSHTDNLPIMITDASKVRQVLFNLLSNAVKFTPDEGTVKLQVDRIDDDTIRLAVSDTGPGVQPENHALIFEKFRQVDQSATREHHGTGLGLAIAKELTELLGGSIGVESDGDSGSTFWVQLPITTTEPHDALRPLRL